MSFQGKHQLTADENTGLIYEQLGFDMVETDENMTHGVSYKHFYPGEGTDLNQYYYLGNPDPNAIWIGIQNIGSMYLSAEETCELQAKSLVGHDLSLNAANGGEWLPGTAGADFVLGIGQIVYGRFSEVIVRVTDTTTTNIYKRLRLIRGTK